MRPRNFTPIIEGEELLKGFTALAPVYWRAAEKLRAEAVAEIAPKASFDSHVQIVPAIILYHAALDCYINEQLALSLYGLIEKANSARANECRECQDMTLNRRKITAFAKLYGLAEKFDQNSIESALKMAQLRDKVYHHSPEFRPMNQIPIELDVVLKAAGVTPINTSWVSLASSLRVGKWCADAVIGFVDAFGAATGGPKHAARRYLIPAHGHG